MAVIGIVAVIVGLAGAAGAVAPTGAEQNRRDVERQLARDTRFPAIY